MDGFKADLLISTGDTVCVCCIIIKAPACRCLCSCVFLVCNAPQVRLRSIFPLSIKLMIIRLQRFNSTYWWLGGMLALVVKVKILLRMCADVLKQSWSAINVRPLLPPLINHASTHNYFSHMLCLDFRGLSLTGWVL